MAFLQIPGVRITGMAGVVPEQVVRNADYEWIPEKERQAFIEHTGIAERRFTRPGVCASDLGAYVTEQLIPQLGWQKNEVELLVFVSQCRDYILPSTACILQDRLGLSKNCMAFDVPLGCSGYVYGLSVTAGMMTNGCIRKALLIAGDISSYHLAYRDKSVYPLFGDAMTVTALEYTGDAGDRMSFVLQTDGSGFEAIIVPDGGQRNDFSEASLLPKSYGDGIIRTPKNIFLDGLKVFEFSIREVAANIKSLLKQISRTTEDFDQVVFHQANKVLNETIRKQLKLDAAKVPYTLSKFGNTSSASIPLTIVSELREAVSGGRQELLLSGFGVGLSWGSAAIRLDHIVCPPLYEHHAG